MATVNPFSRCDEYRQVGHNYCRMCGSRLFDPGSGRRPRVAVEYDSSEKFCGFCGGHARTCPCVALNG
jgi:hypothetical protein